MNSALTHGQRDCLEFLKAYIAREGISPTFAEIADGLKLRSKSGIKRLVVALEERGHIRRLPKRARAIELVAQSSEPAVVNIVLTLDNVLVRATSSGNVEIAYHRQIGDRVVPVPISEAA